MIDISDFKTFLNGTFPVETIWVDAFKPDLQFIQVDCFPNQPIKLAIEISPEDVKVSTVSKEPVLDFSLYEYVFENIADAKNLILRIKSTGVFPSKKKN
jgi:hypothetical protein